MYLTFLNGTGLYFSLILLFLVLTSGNLLSGQNHLENFACFSAFLANFKHKFDLLMDSLSTLSKFLARVVRYPDPRNSIHVTIPGFEAELVSLDPNSDTRFVLGYLLTRCY